MELLALLLFTLFCCFYDRLTKQRWRHLPGPWFILPILGHVEFLLNLGDPVAMVWRIYARYSKGGICYTNFLNQHNVLVGDYDTFRYLCSHPSAQSRVTNFTGSLYKYVSESRGQEGVLIKGVMHSQGNIWREQRRFAVKTLREFGFGKKSMDEMVEQEQQKFINYIDTFQGVSLNLCEKFNLPVLNVLWQITVGDTFHYEDPVMLKIIDQLGEYVRNWGRPQVIFMICMPWIAKLFPKALGRTDDIKVNREIADLMKLWIKNHLESLDVKQPRDFIDSYLIEIASTTSPQSSFYGEEGYENLTATLIDFFQAGSETTSTTLSWAVVYLVLYPEVQQAMQEEIEQKVGHRDILISDGKTLSYCQAVILEVQRLGNILPHGGNHKTDKNVEVNGFLIPADTFITPVYAEILQGSYWKEGNKFDPTRFLDETGVLRKDDHLIVFGSGKRICIGEILAKAQLFLFIAGLVQKYTIVADPEQGPSERSYVPGVTRAPRPFKVILQNRK